jgi:hypothetical protein
VDVITISPSDFSDVNRWSHLISIFSAIMIIVSMNGLVDPSGFSLNDFNKDSSISAYRTRGGLATEHFNLSFEGPIEHMVHNQSLLLESIFEGATDFLNFSFEERTRVNISTDPDILPPQTLDLGYSGYVIPADMSSSGETEMFFGIPPDFSTQSNDNNLDMRISIAAHEFVHVLRDHQTRDHNGSLYPPWLVEGLPTYYAFYHMSESDEYVQYWISELLQSDELKDIDELFLYDYFAVGEGYAIIKYVIDEFGRETFLDFLEAFEDWDGTQTSDDNLEMIFSAVFGKTLEQFNSDWRDYLSEDFAVGFDRQKMEDLPGSVIIDTDGWDMPTSAVNGKLVWVTDEAGTVDIMISNEDGSDERRLTTGHGYDGDAKLDPTGNWIAFTSTRNGNYDLYKMTIDGGNLTQLTNDSSIDIMGSWSPDGEEIVFTSNSRGSFDIYIMRNDGGDRRSLVLAGTDEGSPTFSPDGSKVVFVSNLFGGSDFLIIDYDGRRFDDVLDIMTYTLENESFPSWSPDGKEILYTLRKGFSRKLCVMDFQTELVEIMFEQPSHAGFIGPGIGVLRFPVWSSDGNAIFVAYGGHIFVLRLPSEPPYDLMWIYLLIAIPTVVVVTLALVLRKRNRDT